MDDTSHTRGQVRLFTSFAAAKDEEYAYWQSRPVHERLSAASELSIEEYKLKGTLPVNQDFKDILSHLNAEEAKYLIVGGYAVAIHPDAAAIGRALQAKKD